MAKHLPLLSNRTTLYPSSTCPEKSSQPTKIAPKQATRNQPQNRETRLDRYLIRVQVPPSDYKPMVKNAESIIEFWKIQHDTLLSIAESAHPTETAAELKQRIELAFHGLKTTNEFVITRNAACPKPRNPPTPWPTDILMPRA